MHMFSPPRKRFFVGRGSTFTRRLSRILRGWCFLNLPDQAEHPSARPPSRVCRDTREAYYKANDCDVHDQPPPPLRHCCALVPLRHFPDFSPSAAPPRQTNMTPSVSRGHGDGAHGSTGSGSSRRDLYLMEKMHPENPTTSTSSAAAAAARAGRGNVRGAAGKARSPSSPPSPPKGAGGAEQRQQNPRVGGDDSRSPPPPRDIAAAAAAVAVHGKVGGD